METTSSLFSVSAGLVAPSASVQSVFLEQRGQKGITAGTLEELKEKAAQALLISTVLTLVCEEDGTEVDSDEFLIALPDNTVFMALKPGEIWKPHPLLKRGGNKPGDNKPRTGKDIAQITFDLYRTHPKDVFGSLNVKATYQGLYSVSADFQCLGPKKVLREALRVISTLLQAAGHLLISSAAVIRRIIQGRIFFKPNIPSLSSIGNNQRNV